MKKKFQSLPDFLRNPLCLLWAGLLPQAILAALNLRAWFLVRGEATEEHTRLFAMMGGYQVVMLLCLTAVLLACHLRKRLLGWVVCIPLFLIHIGYLWFITRYIDDMLPREVTTWMLPQHVHLFSQFTLVMPATFYFAARVACFPLSSRPLKDIGITAGTVITIPVLWYLGMRITSHLHHFNVPTIAWTLFWVVSTVVTVMAFLRLMMTVYNWTRRVQSRRWIFVLLAAVAAPIGGLSLNAVIPFPVDLQYYSIYILTLLNAAVLLIPQPKNENWLCRIWFARCATLPFSLYFFLLFLPFLPLALPAMFAVGSGFLILAPTFLFAIHVQLLIDEGRRAMEILGRLRTGICIVAALCVLPGILTLDALLDRANLNAAIDAVYTPNTLAQPRISAGRAAATLKRLDGDKRGVYLPFVSGAYRQLVFNGMILQDRKIAEMYKIFSGEDLESEDGRRNRDDMFNFWTSTRGTTRGRGVRPPPRTVDLTLTEFSSTDADGMVKASLKLSMTNDDHRDAEFITRLKLSPGVLVTGYWLEIDGKRKPGQMYEKRAAMWVYHMIRDVTRRDPGLLIFEDPNTLKLNVFPFAPKQTRYTGIDFLFPASLPAVITIDGESILLGEELGNDPHTLLLESVASSTRLLAIPAGESDKYEATTRRPIIHLLLDRSKPSESVTPAQWQQRMDELKPLLPADALYRVAAVNHSTHLLTDTAVDFASARTAMKDIERIKASGGIAHHQAIRRGVAKWRAQPVKTQREDVPLFVLLTSTNTTTTEIESLSGLEEFTPEVTGYWIHDGNALSFQPYSEFNPVSAAAVSAPGPVVFPVASSSQCIIAGGAGIIMVDDPEVKPDATKVITPAAAQYISGMSIWARWHETVVNPSLLDANYKQLVQDSISTGVMTPVTSFMVVENSAQEEMLKRKQKEALDAKSALDFDEHQESPEPALWLLLIPVLFLANRRHKAIQQHALSSNE